jgi:ribosomal protein S18 acetylase RimI-like enzyme
VDDLITRAYRHDDAAGITDMFNAIRTAAGGLPAYTATETRALISAMVTDSETDTRIVVDADGTPVAAALVCSPPAGGFRADLFGGVHPSRQGRGLGRDLLTWQVARAREIHRSTAPDAEWVADVGAMVAEESALRLYARLGFTPARYFFEMVAPTAQPPDAPLPVGLRSEPYRPELARELYEAHMEAFSDHWGFQRREFDSWRTFTVDGKDFLPELSRVAFDGEEIASYVLSYNDASPERMYIGQVGTRRPWRRRGLAGALMVEVLHAAATADRQFATLDVDTDSPTGAVGVYEKVGFEVEQRDVTYHLPL